MDILIQGGIYKGTIDTALHYLNLSFVEKIIISTWKNEDIPDKINDKIEIIKLDKPEIYDGVDTFGIKIPITINLQLLSSREGLKKTTSAIVAKTRSDQKISLDSMAKMNAYFLKHCREIKREFVDKSGPKGPVFVIGINSRWPFHPQDHVFWGFKSDVEKIFDIPLLAKELHSIDFSLVYRGPIHFGVYYAARFDGRVSNYIKNYCEYLTSSGPTTEKREEALSLSREMMDDIFRVFPPIEMYWEKYNSGYWYSDYASQGEYFGKEW
jgi:hypothetical protein